MPTQQPYTFVITHLVLIYYGVRECFTFRTSRRLTKNCKRVCLANAPKK